MLCFVRNPYTGFLSSWKELESEMEETKVRLKKYTAPKRKKFISRTYRRSNRQGKQYQKLIHKKTRRKFKESVI